MDKSHLKRAKTPTGSVSSIIDPRYPALSRATKQRIQWRELLSSSDWKWLENVRNFSVYTKQGSSLSRGFSILSTGVVRGSVHEIVALMEASSPQEFDEQIATMHSAKFKHGSYIADIANDDEDEGDANVDAKERLSIRSTTFTGHHWLRRDETWCFLDATTYDRRGGNFVKYLTALTIDDALVAESMHGRRLEGANRYQNVVCGYKVEAGESGSGCAQVHFFAEMVPVSTVGVAGIARKHEASASAIYKTLLGMARLCERMSLVVRQRRLGVQVLVNPRWITSFANQKCINCETMQLVAKLCRVCGNAVCKNCSDKYERETRLQGKPELCIEMVRVCDPCLALIEGADYSNTTDDSLTGITVEPNSLSASQVEKAAAHDLEELLDDALRQERSPHRKDAILSVRHCVLDQERECHTLSRTGLSVNSTQSTVSIVDQECLDALDNLTTECVGYADGTLSDQSGRSYVLNPLDVIEFPIPDNEAERLQAILDLRVLDKSEWEELNIICDLAAKEVGASASVISVVTADQHRIVAANNPKFLTMHTDRDNAFCSYTVMENRPLIVPHLEADVRTSHIARKWNKGMKFYCGFPLMADNKTMFGTLCCVDEQTHALTESQYKAMVKLAETASKIIRVEAKKRRPTVA